MLPDDVYNRRLLDNVHPADWKNPDPTGRYNIVVIGAGFGGIALAAKLREAGVHDFVIFERAADLGGTWRDNTYPGCACDVPSHLYSYSFAPNPDWSRMYGRQPEILDYFERCAQQYDLGPHLRLGTEIVSAEWEESARRWRLRTATGEQHCFDVVVSAVGMFTQPVMPALVEEEPFTGTVMHTDADRGAPPHSPTSSFQ